MSTKQERPSYPFKATNGVVVTVELARKPVDQLSPLETTAVLEANRVCGPAKRATTKVGKLNVAIGEAGGICVYGYGRYPINMFAEAALDILDSATELRAFIASNPGLKRKQSKA